MVVETVVVSVLNDVIRAADEGKVTRLVLLDLSSAFDTVVLTTTFCFQFSAGVFLLKARRSTGSAHI